MMNFNMEPAYPGQSLSDGMSIGLASGESVSVLHSLCESASGRDDDGSFEAVREWLRAHNRTEAKRAEMRVAAEHRGEYDTTALHLACRNCAPPDIVDMLMTVAPEIVHSTDSFGWLPLHYACANGASDQVIGMLADAFPDSKVATDRRGRTPLHFALGNIDRPADPQVIAFLADSGAAYWEDENGMLALHYACAYGVSEETLNVLLEAHEASVIATDKRGRTPFHFAMGNADRDASPAVVRVLVERNPEVANMMDSENDQLPLSLLSTRANTLTPDQRSARLNATACLEMYLKSKPRPTPDYLTTLQSLPTWLSEKAVVTPIVQKVLNDKISQRFPTAVLMLDLYFICGIILTFSWTVLESIDRRFDPSGREPTIPSTHLSPLYIGAGYFFIREVVQMLSLLSLGLFTTWLWDPTNALDVTFIFLVVYWSILMQYGMGDKDQFRTGTALTLLVLYTAVLSFLKSMLIDFAVFVGGVFYVVKRLAAFLLALGVILVAFAQMFTTVYQKTEYCMDQVKQTVADVAGDCLADVPFCRGWSSFLKVYTMLLGEVDEADFRDSTFATILFAMFMFLVVILLANVLIAIVTDSYGVIKNERAAIVFWSNRLDFVAEMDAVSNGPWKKKVKCLFPFFGEEQAEEDVPFGTDIWKQLMELFEEETMMGVETFSPEWMCYTLLRIATIFVFIPLWVLLGTFSAGWLWPPQVRAYLFTQRIFAMGESSIEDAKERAAQIQALRSEMDDLQRDLIDEMNIDRDEVDGMRSQLHDIKLDITNGMREIKQIITMLFELQSSLDR